MTYGSLAYKYDYTKEKAPKEQKSRQVEKDSKVETKNKRNISYAQKIFSVVVLTASAIFMIMQFVEVNETVTELESARSDYQFEEAVTAQKTYELEQSIDLSKIEQEATTRLGMKRPEKYQQVYVDVKKNDVTEKVSGEVEGIGNRFSNAVGSIINHIIEFFSI